MEYERGYLECSLRCEFFFLQMLHVFLTIDTDIRAYNC